MDRNIEKALNYFRIFTFAFENCIKIEIGIHNEDLNDTSIPAEPYNQIFTPSSFNRTCQFARRTNP